LKFIAFTLTVITRIETEFSDRS